ncbi:hypothetical protein [Sphingomonas profundi]|uniref:hypothetical protein n=1 Tax=Alterirhizorhabdus profundi TaxID=2681549 RepID=UPI0018D18AD5|nr:hypothetical protein [Sphingomonas profundi]
MTMISVWSPSAGRCAGCEPSGGVACPLLLICANAGVPTPNSVAAPETSKAVRKVIIILSHFLTRRLARALAHAELSSAVILVVPVRKRVYKNYLRRRDRSRCRRRSGASFVRI